MTLVGAFTIVGDEVFVQHRLHLVGGLEPSAASFDPEVVVEECAVKPFHDAVRLWVAPDGVCDRLDGPSEPLVGKGHLHRGTCRRRAELRNFVVEVPQRRQGFRSALEFVQKQQAGSCGDSFSGQQGERGE